MSLVLHCVHDIRNKILLIILIRKFRVINTKFLYQFEDTYNQDLVGKFSRWKKSYIHI